MGLKIPIFKASKNQQMNIDIKNKVIELLNDITENEYKEIFLGIESVNDKMQLLTSESMLALFFVTSIEDEFSIEFDDDEVDIDFFTDIDTIVNKIERHLKK
jgi:hypothetical protein